MFCIWLNFVLKLRNLPEIKLCTLLVIVFFLFFIIVGNWVFFLIGIVHTIAMFCSGLQWINIQILLKWHWIFFFLLSPFVEKLWWKTTFLPEPLPDLHISPYYSVYLAVCSVCVHPARVIMLSCRVVFNHEPE